MAENPKPCPFCGGEPRPSQDGDGLWFVCCSVCSVGTDRCHWLTASEAADAWNRRAPLTAADCMEVSEVRALVDAFVSMARWGAEEHECPRDLLVDGMAPDDAAVAAPFLAAMEAKR